MLASYSHEEEAERYRRFRDASLGFATVALVAWVVFVWSFTDSPPRFSAMSAAALAVAVTATVVSAASAVLAAVQFWGNENMKVLRQVAVHTSTGTDG